MLCACASDSQRWERSQARLCAEAYFSHLCRLQKPLCIRELHAATQTPKTCTYVHYWPRPGLSCCWLLPRLHQSRLDSRRLLPLPSGQKQWKPHCSVPWGLAAPEPLCSNCVQLTPASSCNISECAFESSICKGWENLRLETPLLGVGQVPWLGVGGVCHSSVYARLPVPCFPDSCCTSSPHSRWRKEVMFWTIWWEVGKAVSWVRSNKKTANWGRGGGRGGGTVEMTQICM